jgi:hypothetical protein
VFDVTGSQQIIQTLVGIPCNELEHALIIPVSNKLVLQNFDSREYVIKLTSGMIGFPPFPSTYRKGISVLSCLLICNSGKSIYGIPSNGTKSIQTVQHKHLEDDTCGKML